MARNAFTREIMDHQFIDGDRLPPILVEKSADTPVNLSIYVRLPNAMDEGAVPDAVVARMGPDGKASPVDGVGGEKGRRFRTKNVGRRTPRRWHFDLTLLAEADAGRYRIAFPTAATVIVLESDGPDVRLGDGRR